MPLGGACPDCATRTALSTAHGDTNALAHLETLFAALPAAVIILDRNGVYRFFGGQALTNERSGEALGQSVFAVRRDRPDILADMRRALAGEEVRATREVEGIVWETRYAPLHDAAGEVDGVAYIAFDITGRARAEAALQASEERLRAQYLAFPLPTYIWQHRDGDFVFTDCNAAALAINHESLTARLGQPASIIYRALPEVCAYLTRCFVERTTLQHELRYAEIDFTVTYVYVAPDQVVMHAEDITKRKTAEEALLTSERAFRTLVEQVPAVIYRAQANASGATLFISPQVATMLGYDSAPWLADPAFWTERLHPDDRAQTLTTFAQGHATGLPVRVEYRFRTADDRYLWIRDEATLVRDDSGRALYWQGLMLDVTEQKRAETLLAGQASILRHIAQDTDLTETLTLIAREIEMVIDGALVSIQLLDEQEALLRNIAAPSLPSDYVAAASQVPVGEGIGACGTAAFRRAPVIAADIATDPYWRDYRDIALAHGLHTCWSLPILTNAKAQDNTAQRLLGTFAVYYTTQRQPDAADWRVLERSVGLTALAIARAQAATALGQSAESFTSLFEATGEGMVIHEGGPILTANRTAAAMVGYPISEVVGRYGMDFLTPETRNLSTRLGDAGDERPYEALLQRRDGTYLPVELAGKALQYQGRAARLVTIRDITERKAAEAARLASAASLAAAQQLANLGSWDEDLATGQFAWSDESFRICGYAPQSFTPTAERLVAAIHPDDREAVRLARQVATDGGAAWELDFRIVRPNGEVRILHQQAEVIRDAQGRPIRRHGVVLDVTERRALEARLQHQATHDPLTGLPNRALFLDRLDQALARSRRGGAPSTVIFLDLDNFKDVNDTLGHDAGDQLLIAAAERLRHCLRDEDTLARLGGDEFAALLEGISAIGEAVRAAERLGEALGTPLTVESRAHHVTASIGIVISTPEHTRPDDLLRDADIAMYRAKGAGGARYALFDPAMQDQLVARLALVDELRQALERQEFVLHFQPQIALTSGQVRCVETLVRWQHPTRGFIAPTEFIALAEETGLIRPLGRWVLEEACRQAASWSFSCAGNAPAISVNLSAHEFQDPDLVAEIARVLQVTGLAPLRLELEITESALMEDAPATLATLGRLKYLGVQLAIDDFGTGYSSLAYLKRFPVDTLKIDKAFIDGLGTETEDTAIVTAIITLAQTLGLQVVAEGVETATQVAQLRLLSCGLAQGYYFARPLDEATLTARLRQGNSWGYQPAPITSPPAPTTEELRQRRSRRSTRSLLPTAITSQ